MKQIEEKGTWFAGFRVFLDFQLFLTTIHRYDLELNLLLIANYWAIAFCEAMQKSTPNQGCAPIIDTYNPNIQFSMENDQLTILNLINAYEEDVNQFYVWSQEQILKIIIYILKKSSYFRKTHELQILRKIVQNIRFFQGLLAQENGESLLERCCRKMSYQFINANSILFKQGDVGTTFYIILKGKVCILKQFLEEYEVSQKRRSKNFVEREIATIGDGGAFGELALINDQPRSASVRASTDTHLAVIGKDDFTVIVRNFKNQLNQMYYEGFAQLRLFKFWKFAICKALFDRAKVHEHGLNSLICREGDVVDKLFILSEGECRVVKNVLHSDLVAKDTSFQIENLKKKYFCVEEKTNNKTISERLEEILTHNNIKNSQNHEKTKQVTLKYLTQGEMIGEYEIFEDLQLRQYSVITTSEVVKTYSVPKQEFLRIIEQDKKIQNDLLVLCNQKITQMIKQMQSIKSSIFDTEYKQKKTKLPQMDFIQLNIGNSNRSSHKQQLSQASISSNGTKGYLREQLQKRQSLRVNNGVLYSPQMKEKEVKEKKKEKERNIRSLKEQLSFQTFQQTQLRQHTANESEDQKNTVNTEMYHQQFKNHLKVLKSPMSAFGSHRKYMLNSHKSLDGIASANSTSYIKRKMQLIVKNK